MKRSPILVRNLFCLAVLLLFAAASDGQTSQPGQMMQAAAAPELLGAEWQTSLAPLRAMPVQENGHIRSALAFAEDYIYAIAGTRLFQGRGALPVLFQLMAEPDAAQSLRILRISHPKITGLYARKYISLEDLHDPAYSATLMKMLREDQEGLLKPLNDIQFKADLLEGPLKHFAIVPRTQEWLTPQGLAQLPHAQRSAADAAILLAWNNLLGAVQRNDPAAGASASSVLAQAVDAAASQCKQLSQSTLRFDVFYQTHRPFAKSAVFYMLAALVYGAGLLLNRKKLGYLGYVLLIGGLIEQIIGMAVRWVIAGRAPLSNMYESFTFAVAGIVLIALIFEALQKTQLAGLGGAILGFIFMVLAHNAPIFDSQIMPLRPALQSVWLTYHVAVIMLSYSAFTLSFFFSLCYLMKDAAGGDATRFGVLRRLPSLQSLDILNYRIIAVGFPLLTLGIVFGAVWAQTAWGGLWGFDPKETWSAITWLIYAIYLHVRYLAGWRGRRAAILALLGFACVLFTYLGVNYLLPGLHSYV